MKVIFGNLWNAVDYILSFNFVVGRIPGKANAAADYFSRINLNPAKKMRLKIENQITVSKIIISCKKNTNKNKLGEFSPIEDNKKNEDNFKIPLVVISSLMNLHRSSP